MSGRDKVLSPKACHLDTIILEYIHHSAHSICFPLNSISSNSLFGETSFVCRVQGYGYWNGGCCSVEKRRFITCHCAQMVFFNFIINFPIKETKTLNNSNCDKLIFLALWRQEGVRLTWSHLPNSISYRPCHAMYSATRQPFHIDYSWKVYVSFSA